MLSVQKEAGSNTVKVAEAVRKAVEGAEPRLGGDLSLEIAMDSSVYIQSHQRVAGNAVTGAVLAVAILLLFLRSIRPTLVIGVAIPISIPGGLCDGVFQQNHVKLAVSGRSCPGVGMLVEQFHSGLGEHFPPPGAGQKGGEAAVIGTEEVGMAVTASTLTTISVFVPIVFVSGLTAEIFRDLALTVTFSLLASLLVAVTLVLCWLPKYWETAG